jgi:drug/metabolite transporter (DMT)-like permease
MAATGHRSLTGARLGAGLVLVSALSFGVMPIFAKLAYGAGLNTSTLLALRFCLAALGMWSLWAVLYLRGERVRLSASLLLPVVAMGAIGYVGQSFSYFTAVRLIPASFTGLLLYTYPVLVTVLAWLFFREPLTGRKLLALSVGAIGTLFVLGLGTELFGGGARLPSLNPDGVLWGLAAAVIYSVYIIAGTRYAANVHPVFSSAVIITSAAIVYIFWGLSSDALRWDFRASGWLWAALIAMVCTVIAIATFFAGLKVVGPSRAAIISTVEPAVTVGLAALVLADRISFEQLIGGLLVLSAVVLLQTGRSEPAQASIRVDTHSHEAQPETD